MQQAQVTGRYPLGTTQKSAAIGCVEEHAALTLDRAGRLAAVDGAGAGGVGVDQQIFEDAVGDQSGGFAACMLAEDDLMPFHDQTLNPAACSRPAVSVRGRPTMPVNDPLIHGMKAPASP